MRAPAKERAQRDTNLATVRRLLDAITARDIDAVEGCLHPDEVSFRLPYVDTVPDLDRAGLIEMEKSVFGMWQRFDITIVDIHELLDPDQLIVRYRGDCVSNVGSVPYQNEYVGFFAFRDGLITAWTEYANPSVVEETMDKVKAAFQADLGI